MKKSDHIKFMKQFHNVPCLICGREEGTAGHHVRNQGTVKIDELWNVMPLCVEHHTGGRYAVHNIGLTKFSKLFPAVQAWLIENEWEFLEFNRRWFHK